MAENKNTGTEQGALWGGRFEGGVAEAMQSFGASLPVDNRLWKEDIQGSIAHAQMLGAQDIIPAADADKIVAGLESIAADIEAENWDFFDLADEDIHMNIERELTQRIGEAGGKLHTGRSRNDQVATDMRLYCKGECAELAAALNQLRATLIKKAEAHLTPGKETIMPGYTHLQKAQPVLFAHHLMAYQWMFARDCKRFMAAAEAADVLVLGSAALAGTTYALDRDAVATALGFASVSPNSLDAVSDRDFICDAVYASTLAMVHLSRLCEELILWSSDEFGFITLDDAYATGSSIMPQKKNPDFAELTRGKTGRVIGDLVGLLTTLKGLPLAYNKDLQEDKEGAFDAFDTLAVCLEAVCGMIDTMQVNAEAMAAGAQGGFMAATDLADYLVGKGVAFREAHEIVGRVVLSCEQAGRCLQDLSSAELAKIDEHFGDDALEVIDIRTVVAQRTTVGGTAPKRVAEQIAQAKKLLSADSS
ncbi:MAG: argininosuccinate lyase [Coriobacteriia bacterium]|jgi:argininosuccinate lyase|nr:argininosuccinate lyase [Coriobacteriia bacterium]MDR2715073.1 argininosuccinate lyase [Coriobacteriales bacterium]